MRAIGTVFIWVRDVLIDVVAWWMRFQRALPRTSFEAAVFDAVRYSYHRLTRQGALIHGTV